MSYAHSEDDVDSLLAVYDEVLPLVGEALIAGDLQKRLRGKMLEPLFKVR